MKLVTMTRDMRPYQAGNDAALPDAMADKLIAAGDAKLSPKHEESGLQPDGAAPPAPKPPARNRFLARGRQ